jgi:hypothetical protein
MESRDRRLAALAARQRGLVHRRQLHALGFGDAAIARLVAAGRLHRIHAGVYAVGHSSLPREARLLAAVLACGPGALLSHRSAGWVWRLCEDSAVRIDVTVPSRHRRASHAPIAVHRSRRPLEADEHDGLPVTSVARTLVDLAEVLPSDRALEKAVERSIETRRFDAVAVEAAIAAHGPGRRGPARLRRLLLVHDAEATFTRSALEDAVLELCDAHGLPRPLTNLRVAGHEVDCAWPGARLIVEADSWTHHRSRSAFERDRRRDAALVEAGWRVVRLTHDRVHREAADTAALLGRLLRWVQPHPTGGRNVTQRPPPV